MHWNLLRGVSVIPRSTSHVAQNLRAVAGPRLNEHDLRLIASCERGARRFPDLIAVWPTSATRAQRLLGALLSALAFVLFVALPMRVDALRIAKWVGDRRERREQARAAKPNAT